MTLTEAVIGRDELRARGVKCQLRYEGADVWKVLLEGTDY